MDETLLRVDKPDGTCKCAVFFSPTGPVLGREQDYPGHPYAFIPCRHGSTVEVLNVRVVECARCVGTGTVKRDPTAIARGWDAEVPCMACLGTGLRLAEIGDQDGEEEAPV